MSKTPALKAPFPYPGGKSKVAAEVWRRLGDTPNFIEPFMGSAAVLLARPPFTGNRIETVNDADGHVANFWRALSGPNADPDAVAAYADWPVSELDLHARGDWLFYRPDARAWVEQLRADPDYYDAKSAGWWVWFVSCWIGGLPSIPENGVTGQGGGADGVYERLPALGDSGKGVARQMPHVSDAGAGVPRQRPHLGSGGQGNGVQGQVSRKMPHAGNAAPGVARQVPAIGDAGRATARVNGEHIDRKRPDVGGAENGARYGRGVNRVEFWGQRRANLTAYMRALAARLERVRVCCGDWSRVTGPSVTFKHGVTGVFLDPPYSAEADRQSKLYSTDDLTVAHDAREWAIANGDNPLMRIALCGYDGEGHEVLQAHGWQSHYWKANGGYGNQGNGRGRANAGREVIWFSPHCLNGNQPSLFETL